uniref:non-specific serine/threonine protein kinase n=2 Tax=Oreochromis aureus TaxID=47969 RepID=A0AAZ1XBZ2_OREAU
EEERGPGQNQKYCQKSVAEQKRDFQARYVEEHRLGEGGCGAVFAGYRIKDHFPVILKQLVDAAKHLEDKHIFHRDIKSENILIETGSDVPRVRIIDFGLSCFVKERSLYRVFYGTDIYSPPEWYRQGCYRCGPTTVWQMGVVLYEALHVGDFNTTGFLKKRLKFKSRLSKRCRDFLDACLTRVPEMRPTLEDLQHHAWLR